MIRPAAALAAAMLLAACGGPSGPAAEAPAGAPFAPDTNSPIAGTTLACTGDYPDSRLVFGRDGRLSGRYAGQDVTGWWTARGNGAVEVLVQAGGLAVRDVLQRAGAGWRGRATGCG